MAGLFCRSKAAREHARQANQAAAGANQVETSRKAKEIANSPGIKMAPAGGAGAIGCHPKVTWEALPWSDPRSLVGGCCSYCAVLSAQRK